MAEFKTMQGPICSDCARQHYGSVVFCPYCGKATTGGPALVVSQTVAAVLPPVLVAGVGSDGGGAARRSKAGEEQTMARTATTEPSGAEAAAVQTGAAADKEPPPDPTEHQQDVAPTPLPVSAPRPDVATRNGAVATEAPGMTPPEKNDWGRRKHVMPVLLGILLLGLVLVYLVAVVIPASRPSRDISLPPPARVGPEKPADSAAALNPDTPRPNTGSKTKKRSKTSPGPQQDGEKAFVGAKRGWAGEGATANSGVTPWQK